MSPQTPTDLTVIEAQRLLEQFTCMDITATVSIENSAVVRQALVLLAQESEYQMLGICADSRLEAIKALEEYLPILGYNSAMNCDEIPTIAGPVYMKFNGRSGSYHISPYLEKYRGVLVSCQSSESEGVNGTYGHFPLNLFATAA